MGDKSDVPAYLAALGVALIVGAALAYLHPVLELPAPTTSIVLLFVAACAFAGGAAIKAAERRH